MTREPVVSAQAIAAAVSAVIMLGLAMAVSLGWIVLDSNQMGSIEAFVGAIMALLVLVAPQLVAAWWARSKVTPVANPKLPDGEPAALVPLATAQAMGMMLRPFDAAYANEDNDDE
jgi:CelD/BcsL family acetyltransferase involved in cellulose biosynthesis